MDNFTDIFSSSNPEFEENIRTIIELTASRILKKLKDARKPVPAITYPSFSPELDRNHPFVDRIVDEICTSLNQFFSLKAGSYIAPDILRIIFEGVFIRLKLSPIRDRDKKWNVHVYRSDDLLSEIIEEPSDAMEHHNRIEIFLEQELSQMQKGLIDALSWRLRALEDYFSSHSKHIPKEEQNELNKLAHARILQSDIDIRVKREKIGDFCEKNWMRNPFYFLLEKTPQKHFSSDDQSLFAKVWRVFHLSQSEVSLKFKFLPEGFSEEEPYLFQFPVNTTDFTDEEVLSQEKIANLYRRAYERKLLIYYFASTVQRMPRDQQEINQIQYQITSLSEEIREYQQHILYEAATDEEECTEVWDDENETISRVQFLYHRVEVLRKRCTASEIGPEAVSIFYTISHALYLFIDTAATLRLPATIAPEALKNQVMEWLKATLYATLDHALTDLKDTEEESISTMRSIIREACNLLYHN
jgi:hypothetical protein